MSYTFTAVLDNPTSTIKVEPCLCAQGAACFSDAFNNGVSEAHRQELALEAWEKCSRCKGTGVEEVDYDDSPSFNLGQCNAVALLRVLGIYTGENWGQIGIPEARRAVMRARARTDLTQYLRAEESLYGAPRANGEGLVEMRPLRSLSFGLDEAGLRDRIERFARFVEQAAEAGAEEIFWS